MSTTKTARVSWKGTGLDFASEVGSGYKLDLSSKPGVDAGSPMEMLLAGVVGCTAIDVVMILQKQRQPVTGLEVEIKAERAETYPMVYTDAELTYIVKGDVDANAVEKAIELSEEKYCSASIMFRLAGVKMQTTYRIEPETEAVAA